MFLIFSEINFCDGLYHIRVGFFLFFHNNGGKCPDIRLCIGK